MKKNIFFTKTNLEKTFFIKNKLENIFLENKIGKNFFLVFTRQNIKYTKLDNVSSYSCVFGTLSFKHSTSFEFLFCWIVEILLMKVKIMILLKSELWPKVSIVSFLFFSKSELQIVVKTKNKKCKQYIVGNVVVCFVNMYFDEDRKNTMYWNLRSSIRKKNFHIAKHDFTMSKFT